MKKKKTRRELAHSFFLNTTEIQRLFGIGRSMAINIFSGAMLIDEKELGNNVIDDSKVRLSSVLQTIGITQAELEKKVGHETDIQR